MPNPILEGRCPTVKNSEKGHRALYSPIKHLAARPATAAVFFGPSPACWGESVLDVSALPACLAYFSFFFCFFFLLTKSSLLFPLLFFSLVSGSPAVVTQNVSKTTEQPRPQPGKQRLLGRPCKRANKQTNQHHTSDLLSYIPSCHVSQLDITKTKSQF